jgi:Ca-activated chloride channel homolog
LPSQQQTLILAIDVSLSMRATDVEPTRLSAAQVAAKSFIEDLPKDVRLGIVQFAGTASVVQTPTKDKEELLAAIDRLQLQRGTATGSGIIVALTSLFPDAGIDLEALVFSSSFSRFANRGVPLDKAGKGKAEEKTFTPVPPGSHKSAAIVLLSDGRRTMGPDPLDAAKMAADRGVRIYTIGFGTNNADNGWGSWSIYMRLDEETLRAIADSTKAEYFHAGTAAELRKVYDSLSTKLVLEKQHTEVSAILTGVGALLALGAALLSLLWFNRSM